MLLAACEATGSVLLAASLRALCRLIRLLGADGAGCYEVWDVRTLRSVALLVSHGNGNVAIQE